MSLDRIKMDADATLRGSRVTDELAPDNIIQYTDKKPKGRVFSLEFQRLFNEHRAALLHALTRRFGPPPPDPDDAIQSALLKFIELHQRECITNARAFLFAMARNIMIDELRRMKVRAAHRGRTRAGHIECDNIDDRTPESVILDRERFDILNSAIADLPKQARTVLVLSRIENLTYSEIASRTGLSRSYISRSIQKSMKLLSERLNSEGLENG